MCSASFKTIQRRASSVSSSTSTFSGDAPRTPKSTPQSSPRARKCHPISPAAAATAAAAAAPTDSATFCEALDTIPTRSQLALETRFWTHLHAFASTEYADLLAFFTATDDIPGAEYAAEIAALPTKRRIVKGILIALEAMAGEILAGVFPPRECVQIKLAEAYGDWEEVGHEVIDRLHKIKCAVLTGGGIEVLSRGVGGETSYVTWKYLFFHDSGFSVVCVGKLAGVIVPIAWGVF